ncbi:hypothetical protein SH611_12670 [Geminicoccaceae bacterium 1502E]|nr:hypothetical protein [Geminicoccaceae bacterium 1502E]
MSYTLFFDRGGESAQERFETLEAAVAFAADGLASGLLDDGRVTAPDGSEALAGPALRAAAERHRRALEEARAHPPVGDLASKPSGRP